MELMAIPRKSSHLRAVDNVSFTFGIGTIQLTLKPLLTLSHLYIFLVLPFQCSVFVCTVMPVSATASAFHLILPRSNNSE